MTHGSMMFIDACILYHLTKNNSSFPSDINIGHIVRTSYFSTLGKPSPALSAFGFLRFTHRPIDHTHPYTLPCLSHHEVVQAHVCPTITMGEDPWTQIRKSIDPLEMLGGSWWLDLTWNQRQKKKTDHFKWWNSWRLQALMTPTQLETWQCVHIRTQHNDIHVQWSISGHQSLGYPNKPRPLGGFRLSCTTRPDSVETSKW